MNDPDQTHTTCEDRRTLHGVLLAVFGRGVLVLGPSGSGKSNLALEMIDRGHALVADDAVELTLRKGLLKGCAPAFASRVLALRGIGFVDVVEAFGSAAFIPEVHIDRCVYLGGCVPADPGGEQRTERDFLGVALPLLCIADASPSAFPLLIETWVRFGAEKARRTARRVDRLHADALRTRDARLL